MTLMLSPDHVQQLVKGSGIAEALVTRSGCSTATQPAQLQALGFKDYQRRVPALVLPVHDVHGRLALHQIRPDHPRKNKRGKVLKYDTPEGQKLVLAVAPEHRDLLPRAEVPLLVIEGLKKKWSVDSRLLPGQPVCTVGVIGTWGWRRDGQPLPDWQAIALTGRTVTIVYDSDVRTVKEVGQARAALAAFVREAGAHVQHIDFPALPGMKTGADDYLVQGHSLQDLLALAQETFPQPEPIITTLADYEEQDTRWLWWPYLPYGALVLLDGDPGCGKSLLTLQLAASLSRGWPLPDQQGTVTLPTGPPQRTLLITAEDSISRTIKKRCRLAGGDDAMVDLCSEWQDSKGRILPFTLQSVAMLDRALTRKPYALIVIDPIQAFLGDIDAHRSSETRPVLQELAKVLERHDVCAVCIRHPSKPGQGASKAIYRGQGNVDFIGCARTAVFVEEHPTDDTKSFLCQTKSNLERKGRTLVFSKEAGCFEWQGVSRLPAEVLAGDRRGPDPRAFLEAFCWLEEVLAGGVPRLSTDLEKDAKDEGVKHDTLLRAKKALGVRSVRQSSDDGKDVWYWRLPALPRLDPPPPTTDSSTTTVTTTTTATSNSSTESSSYDIPCQDGEDGEDGEERQESEVTVVVQGVVGGNGSTPPPSRPPQPCPSCQKPTTWVVRGACYACCYCSTEVPREEAH